MFVTTGQGLLGSNMFAYCNNNPVNYIDHLGNYVICVLNDPMNVNRALMTPGMFGGGGGGAGGYVAGVSSSYYVSQNVKNYDRWWRNSCYNPNMGWSNGAVENGVSIVVSGDTKPSESGTLTPSTVPYPGDDPTCCNAPGFSWRGSGEPGSSKGNYYNLQTGEWLHPDLLHPMPIGPHWDYGRRGSHDVYRVYPDGTMKLK